MHATRHAPHRAPARSSRTVVMLVVGGLSIAACGGSSSHDTAGSGADSGEPGAAITVVPVDVEEASNSDTDFDSGSGAIDNGSGAIDNGSAPIVGQGCESAGEGAAADVDGEQAVCTRMQGDGKLIWAWPDGSIAGEPGAGMSDASLAQMFSAGSCDTASDVDRYSTSIIDPASISYLYPLGGMLGSHITPVDHVYVYFPEPPDTSVAPDTYTISSPADGRVVAVEDFQLSNDYPYPDHRIVIEHSCDLYSVFIHVGELRGALADAFADGILGEPLPVSAGDVVADDSANPGFDFSTFDSNVSLQFANPESYGQAEQWKPYTADPLAYFPDDVRTAFEQRSLRVDAPLGGRIDWDLVGTARGNWFVDDTNGYRGVGTQAASYDNHGEVAHGYWDTHLAMAPDAVDPSAFVYSIGDWNGCPCQFLGVGNPDPAAIVASDVPTVIELIRFSYANADGTPMDVMAPTKGYRLTPAGPVVGLLAVQVHDDGTMTVEKLPDVTSASAFTGFGEAAQVYVR